MDTLWVIALVMLGAGVLGGLINFYISQQTEERPLRSWQHIVVGIGASFMVPLFLNMISSSLIDQIRGVPATHQGVVGTAPDPSKLFVLAGFCLVAAVSSRAFIQSMARRLIREFEEVREEVREAKADVAVATAAVAPFVEGDIPETSALVEAQDSQLPELSPIEQSILRTLESSSYSMRSLSGTAKDTGIEKSKVNAALTTLIQKGLVEQAQNSEGKLRFYLTSAGRTHVASFLRTPVA